MSVHVSSLVWKAELPMSEKIVLLKLADHAKDNGTDVFPTQKRVARECGCSDRHVRKVIEKMVGLGVLVEQAGPRNRPKEYAFDLAVLGGTTFQSEQDSTRNHVPPSRNHVPPERNHVPTINKNHQLTTNQPSKGKLPFSGADVPEEFSSIRESLVEWEGYRKSLRIKPWAKATWEKNFRKYAGDPKRMAAAIDHSISKGYQGLFEPDQSKALARNESPQDQFKRLMGAG